jgi:SAM-dependent methyltransferase
VGGFVAACRKRGLAAYGVEPDRIGNGSKTTAIQIAAQRLDTPAFVVGIGERLPFASASFDLAVLDQVIEHVSDQAAVIGEALRVVKPNGAVYIACPNYLCFYEPHYKIAFLPLMPKLLGKLYLKLRGRNPVLLEQIRYTTNWRVRKLLGKFPLHMVCDLNSEEFIRKCGNGSFASAKARLIRRLTRLPVLGKALMNTVLFYIRLRERGTAVLVSPNGFAHDRTIEPTHHVTQVA